MPPNIQTTCKDTLILLLSPEFQLNFTALKEKRKKHHNENIFCRAQDVHAQEAYVQSCNSNFNSRQQNISKIVLFLEKILRFLILTLNNKGVVYQLRGKWELSI